MGNNMSTLVNVAGAIAAAAYPIVVQLVESLMNFHRMANQTPEVPRTMPEENPEEMRRIAQMKLDINTVTQVNLGFCGSVKTGKSTLINSVRGIDRMDPSFAPTGVFETTQIIRKYQLHPLASLVLWDIPGCDTTGHPRATYFEDKYLYAFDFLIIMCGRSLTEAEIVVAKGAIKYGVPFALVRSRCDEDLRNLKVDGKITQEIKDKFRTDATAVYLDGLPSDVREKVKKLFLISGRVMQKVVTGRINVERPLKYTMDEVELLQYIHQSVVEERYRSTLSRETNDTEEAKK